MQRWGMPVKQWSPAHSRFAIELLTDCRKSLMSKARVLDSHMEDEERDRARCERDPDARPRLIGDVAHTNAVRAYVDKPALLAAALYAQWCADHIANECVQLDRDLSEFVGQFAADEDDLALIEHPANSFGFECSVVPAAFPPPFPMALAAAGSLLVGRHTRLDDVRDMLTEAAAAIALTTTATTEAVHGHISWLIGWCSPAATPLLEPEAFEDTAVGLLGEFRQRLLAIGYSLADSEADRDRLLAGAAYTQWIADTLQAQPGFVIAVACGGSGHHSNLQRVGHYESCDRILTFSACPESDSPPQCEGGGMGQPHKGDRMLLQTRPPKPVWDAVHAEAKQAGLSVSQYLADILAVHVGRADLVRELGRTQSEEELPLAV